MPRPSAAERLDAIIDAAITVFGRVGFGTAQVADIAREAGVSVGTVYNYVTDKDTLLVLAVERELLGAGTLEAEELPIERRGDLVHAVEERLEALLHLPSLDKAADVATPADARAVLEAVAGEMYDTFTRTRRGADALERSAREVPELASMFYEGVRVRLFGRLTDAIARWAEVGAIPPPVDAAVSARAVVETITWLARHRHGDFDGAEMDDELVRATAIDFVTRGIVG